MHSAAYDLGCKYAEMVYVKTARSQTAKAVGKAGRSIAETYLGSRPMQYAVGGLGGAGLGALVGGDENRLRGAIIGAGAGLGATGLGRVGAQMGRRSVSSEKVHKELLERGLKDRPKNLEKVRRELERGAAERGVQMMLPLGALGGASLARPFAPSHEEKSWLSRLRG